MKHEIRRNAAHVMFPVVIVAALMAGCSGKIASPIAQRCSDTLELAEKEMNKTDAEGVRDSVSLTKAAYLITAATAQKQFERYEGCLDKAQRALEYIHDARKR